MNRLCSNLALLCLLPGLCVSCLWAGTQNTAPIQLVEEQSVDSGLGFAFGIYDKLISPVDGDRCMMYPSCSVYSRMAIAEYGLLKGFLISADRIMRCGMDSDLYPLRSIGEKDYYYDPIPGDQPADPALADNRHIICR